MPSVCAFVRVLEAREHSLRASVWYRSPKYRAFAALRSDCTARDLDQLNIQPDREDKIYGIQC